MNVEHLLFGAAYYAEYLPYERVEQDMEMMERAGMNVIRIAESTWSTWEPKEGEFDFSKLKQMIEAAAKHHLNVIVGTPTYAIPTWLVKKDATMLAVTKNGQELYGHRQNMDITNPTYLKYAKRMIEKLLDFVVPYPNVIGFQLDNETKHYGTAGERVQKMFVESLKKQFPDIDEFNREFGLDYWSNRINRWEDFPDVRGTINQSLWTEFEKFRRSLVTNFFQWQADIVNAKKRPDQFITHNFDFEWHDFSYGLQPEVNQYDSVKCMTVAGADIYHPSQEHLTGAEITVCGNIARSLKKDNYLILETQAQGNTEWLAYPGQLRQQAYSHIANGANSVMYWHWHSLHNAIESYWKGVLSHDFSENATYRDVNQIGHEFQKIGDKIKNLMKTNSIAVLVDNESLTGLSAFPLQTTGSYSYNTVLRWLCDCLYRNNIEFDMVSSKEASYSNYNCLIVPALYSATDTLLHTLDDYVAQGGHLVTTFKSGFSDEHLKIRHDMQPHILNKCLGIHYDQFTYPEHVGLSFVTEKNAADASSFAGEKNTADMDSCVKEWMELVTCDTAAPVATYRHPAWKEYAAITRNEYGKGSSLYLGCYFDANLLEKVLIPYVKDAIVTQYTFPVILKCGKNDAGNEVLFYFNYSWENQEITYEFENATDLFTENRISTGDRFTLKAWDVKILEVGR